MALQPTKRGAWCRADRKKSYRLGDVSPHRRLAADGPSIAEVVGGGLRGADRGEQTWVAQLSQPGASYIIIPLCLGNNPTAADTTRRQPFSVRVGVAAGGGGTSASYPPTEAARRRDRWCSELALQAIPGATQRRWRRAPPRAARLRPHRRARAAHDAPRVHVAAGRRRGPRITRRLVSSRAPRGARGQGRRHDDRRGLQLGGRPGRGGAAAPARDGVRQVVDGARGRGPLANAKGSRTPTTGGGSRRRSGGARSAARGRPMLRRRPRRAAPLARQVGRVSDGRARRPCPGGCVVRPRRACRRRRARSTSSSSATPRPRRRRYPPCPARPARPPRRARPRRWRWLGGAAAAPRRRHRPAPRPAACASSYGGGAAPTEASPWARGASADGIFGLHRSAGRNGSRESLPTPIRRRMAAAAQQQRSGRWWRPRRGRGRGGARSLRARACGGASLADARRPLVAGGRPGTRPGDRRSLADATAAGGSGRPGARGRAVDGDGQRSGDPRSDELARSRR